LYGACLSRRTRVRASFGSSDASGDRSGHPRRGARAWLQLPWLASFSVDSFGFQGHRRAYTLLLCCKGFYPLP